MSDRMDTIVLRTFAVIITIGVLFHAAMWIGS
jgi:hypothetical protein